jgi:PDZ domain-containing secreted protein
LIRINCAITALLVSGNDANSDGGEVKIDATLKAGSGTDAETLAKEEEAINIDGLNVKQVKELRDKVSHSSNFHSLEVSFKKMKKKKNS